MKKRAFSIWLWGILIFAHIPFEIPSGFTQESAGVSLTLEQAVDRALSQHPQIKAAQYRLESGEAGVQSARSPLLPQVYLTEKYNNTNNPMWAFGTKLNQGSITAEDFDPDRLNDPDAINNFNTSLSLSWEIFSGDRTQAGLEQARQNQEIALVSLRKVRQEVIAHTAKAYIALLLATENLGVADQAVKTAKAHFDFVESRYKGGFVVKSDLLRSQVRQAELEQERLTAESRLHIAMAALNAALGNSENLPIQATTPFREYREIEETEEVWIDKALSHHPDLKQFEPAQKLAELEIRKAKAGYWPSVNLMGSYDWDTKDFDDFGDSYTVGAFARINLYGGGQTRAGVLAATAMLKRVQELKKSQQLIIVLKTRQAFYEAQSAFKRIGVAYSALTQSEEGLRIVENRYRNGMLALVSFLDAEAARREARVNHFKALHDYKSARIDLMTATGILDSEWKTIKGNP